MPKEWWKSYFDENYLAIYELSGQFKSTKKQVNFLTKAILLKKNYRILDLCCGHGRHSLELAKRGYDITGLDYSDYELEIAREEAKKQKLLVKFKKGDARTFGFSEKFDVIINMFTAFGYGSRKDDQKIVHSVSKNLKKGGLFFLDLMSLPWIWRNYQPHKKQKFGAYKITYKRHFDFLNNINYQDTSVTRDHTKKDYYVYNRFYTLADLAELLREEGFKVVKFWGSFSGKPYGLDSKRMLVLAKKLN